MRAEKVRGLMNCETCQVTIENTPQIMINREEIKPYSLVKLYNFKH